MSNNLNLDELLPEARTITINGKEYDCNHPTLEQLLRIADLEVQLVKIKTVEEAIKTINKTLEPIIPNISEVSFTKEQLTTLIRFVIDGTKPQSLEKDKHITPKKKADSPK
jgi:hypothetical protein